MYRKTYKYFSNLEYKNKISFTSKDYRVQGVTYIKCPKKYSEIKTSYDPFRSSKILI